MNEVLVEFELGPAALQYMRERLAEGKTLAHYLLEREDLPSGSVITCLPQSVPVETLEDFGEGYKLKRDPATFRYHTEPDGSITRFEPVPNTDPWLVSVAQRFLRSASDRVCIFEHSSAAPGDPWLESSPMRALFFEGEVYPFLSNKDAESEDMVLTTIRGAKSWLFYGAMTSLSSASDLPFDRGTVGRELLETLARRAEKIVVGAYDHESYLIWQKRGS